MLEELQLREREDELREAVRRANGKVVVLMHPWFNPLTLVKTAGYVPVLTKLMTESKVPVVIFEEMDRLLERRMVSSPASFFFVATTPQMPVPIESWSSIHETFARAGVKTVLIGGMYSLLKDCNRWKGDASLDKKRAREIRDHDSALPLRPKESVIHGCVAVAYHSFITARNEKGRLFPKVRLMPQVLAPDKPKYKRSR